MIGKKVRIIGVPLDLGARRLGVDMGPSAIRYARLHDALQFNDIEFTDGGDLEIRHEPGTDPKHTIARVSEELAELVAGAMREDYVPVILGGDHSTAIGSIAGAAKVARELGVIWIDFHLDANTPETSPSGNIHGMPVAIALGHGYPELVDCAGFSPKVLPQNICLIGGKDMDPGEVDLLHRLGVKTYTLFDIVELGIPRVMDEVIEQIRACDAVHLSFDIDALDPLIAPGTGILSKGGLSYREISYIMEALGKEGIVTSVDIIEINPLLDVRNTTSELAVELLLSCLGGSFSDYERNYILEQRAGKGLSPEI